MQEQPWPSKFSITTPAGPREVDIYSEEGFQVLSGLWTRSGWQQRLSYELTWLGIPIIQMPEDLLMMQELIYKLRPDVLVETGTAHGGTAVFYASIMELLGRGRVISIDVEIRKYNRLAILSHPLSRRITLLEGSSTDAATLQKLETLIQPGESVLVALDSNHSLEHVSAELQAYSRLVTPGSYLVVFDGVMAMLTDAPGGKPEWEGDNPSLAVEQFISSQPQFERDPYYNRLAVTYCPGGFLKRKAE